MRHNHFRTGRPKKLTKHDIRRLISILRKGEISHGKGWQKKLVFIYLPKRLNEHLIVRGIIGVGLAKSHLSIGKLRTLEKYMQ
jgi:hypothetical protein